MEGKRKYLFISIAIAVLAFALFLIFDDQIMRCMKGYPYKRGTWEFLKPFFNYKNGASYLMKKRAIVLIITKIGLGTFLLSYIRIVYKKVGLIKEGLFKGLFLYGLPMWIMAANLLLFNYVAPEKTFSEALSSLLLNILVCF